MRYSLLSFFLGCALTIQPVYAGVFDIELRHDTSPTRRDTEEYKKMEQSESITDVSNNQTLGLNETSTVPTSARTENMENSKKSHAYREGEILIKYKESTIDLATQSGRVKALDFARAQSLTQTERIPESNVAVLTISDGKTVDEKISELKRNKNIEFVQPNFQYYPTDIVTNDTHRALQWGLDNTGQVVNTVTGLADADIDAPEAWAINEGTHATSAVIVAIIDTGVAYNHPDLAGQMWDGAQCVSDTNTALGNCNHGYDFEDNDKTPLPTYSSHGTHIAGSIGAEKNNALGIIGVAPEVRIMALKSSLTTSENVKAINFAKYNGAKVINASWAGSSYDIALKNAIDAFPGIFVAAAGNDAGNNENAHKYPSDFNSSNIISVTATNQDDGIAYFASYGATSVDVGAPGTSILSTVSHSNIASQNFESVVAPALPAGWTEGGTAPNWGTYDHGGDWGTVLYGDIAIPYANNASTSITAPSVDMSGVEGASLDFWAHCDTEYNESAWVDYMTLSASGDGVNFTELERWDEATLDLMNGDPLDDTGSATYHFTEIAIPAGLQTANFSYQFQWVTNASDNAHDGCYVDDVVATVYSDGSDELYGYMSGTSMAAPHVAGLVALVEGYNPTLTTSEVKNFILTSGDDIPDLTTTTVSGKRINARSALIASAPGKAITSFNFTTPSVTGVIHEDEKTITLTVPYGTVVTALTPAITLSNGATVNPLSGVSHDFSATSTYTVTALDGTTETYDVVVSVALSTSKEITAFSFPEGDGVISGTSIAVSVPYGTQVTALVPTITSTGISVSPPSGEAHDFSSPVSYTVTASDATTQTYTVTVNVRSGGGGGGGGGSSKPKKVTTTSPTVTVSTPTPSVPTSTVGLTTTRPTYTFVFLTDLKQGSQGTDVIELQKRLMSEGVYTGGTSGYFGQLTFAGVQAYQRKFGIQASGYVGPQTRAKLNATTGGVISTPPSQSVTALINALKAQLVILLVELAKLRTQ